MKKDEKTVHILLEDLTGITMNHGNSIMSTAEVDLNWHGFKLKVAIFVDEKQIFCSKLVKGKQKFVFQEIANIKIEEIYEIIFRFFNENDEMYGETKVDLSALVKDNSSITVEVEPVGYFAFSILPSNDPQVQKSLKDSQELLNKEMKESKSAQTIHKIMEHKFVAKHLDSPHFCPVCHKFIWGLFNKQAYGCIICNYIIHKKCLYKVFVHCIGENKEHNLDRFPHNFLPKRMFIPAFCGFCGNFMFTKAFRCQMCKLKIHEKCIQGVETHCLVHQNFGVNKNSAKK